MRSLSIVLIVLVALCSCQFISNSNNQPNQLPKDKSKVWIFIMAGQSNMAGRATIEPFDTITNPRIFTINKWDKLVLAKEPLHKYEPGVSGLDCGLSFANHILLNAKDSIYIILVPAAIGGSSIDQWLYDSVHRKVKLYSNLLSKVEEAKKYGIVKGVLWIQGEEEAVKSATENYKIKLQSFILKVRNDLKDSTIPFLIGRIKGFDSNILNWEKINNSIDSIQKSMIKVGVINTSDLDHAGDKIHFDSNSQRLIGKRFATELLPMLY